MLKGVESKKHYRVKVWNVFAALENMDKNMDIGTAWKIIRQNIRNSATQSPGSQELEQHKPWFDE